MKHGIFQSAMVDMRRNVALWMGIGLLSIATNAMLVTWLMINNPREVHTLLPPEVDRPFSIHGNNYSKDYIEQMSTWFVSQVLTYTPATFEYQKNTFLKYADPEYYGALNATLTKDAEYIKQQQVTSSFFPKEFKARGMMGTVTGTLITYVGQHKVAEKDTTWQIKYRPLEPTGRIAVTDFREIKDDQTSK